MSDEGRKAVGYIKENMINAFRYIKAFLMWILISVVVGAAGGVLGTLFHISIDYVTELREHNGYLILCLPVAGILIAFMYRIFVSKGKIDTNRVLEGVRSNEKIPLVMMPLIYISTAITHLFGGSAGREGAALQLGGSMGYNFGRLLHLKKQNMKIIVMSGMSSVFSALFGTPLTAAVFSIEVTNVGEVNYSGILPCVVSSVVACAISSELGVGKVSFLGIVPEAFSVVSFVKIAILALLCAFVSMIFCTVIKKSEHLMQRFFKNKYIRAFTGGLAIVLMTVLVGGQDYNGAGMGVIERAIGGEAKYEAFILKIVFTAITVAAGFKGGEIVPTFFIGATFGCAAAPVIGINPSFAAAIGMVTMFCCVVNCPIASMLLSIEVFGAEGLWFFAMACCIGYMMSGYFGIYGSQKIIFSKLDGEFADKNAK